jgi:hypothetical protein
MRTWAAYIYFSLGQGSNLSFAFLFLLLFSAASLLHRNIDMGGMMIKTWSIYSGIWLAEKRRSYGEYFWCSFSM